jgi:hypothetical protein
LGHFRTATDIASNAFASKNKFVKKAHPLNAQNTLSFFCRHTSQPKKMKECFRHPEKERQKQNSPVFGAVS